MRNRKRKRLERQREERKLKSEAEASTPAIHNITTTPSITKQILDFKIYLKDCQNPIVNGLKITAYTSINPSHVNAHNQLMAVESWHKSGIEIYSLNTLEEIQVMKQTYPSWVKFIPSIKTSKHIFGKPCILINEMIEHFYKNQTGDILMLINSDIILNTSIELLDKIKSLSKLCIPISHRNDYTNEFNDGQKYKHGFDVFFINKKYINIFPHSIYSMGQTWWDYWIPYIAMKNKVPVFLIEDEFAFHKEHPIQYDTKNWSKMTEYFKWENNITGSNHQEINNNIRDEIINNSISFKLCQKETLKHQL